MWCDFIRQISQECKFAGPASSKEIAEAESSLAVTFPNELRSLLLETDGILGPYGLGLIWQLERIVADNLLFRSYEPFRDLYMPFDSLLFFADAGNGDQFAFSILAKEIRRPDIFAWTHENDSRIWQAPHLRTYFEWGLNGTISL